MDNYFINEEMNGIEVSFESKPSAATLDALKAAGFRWHRAKKIWYAKQTAERLTLAQELTEGATTAPAQATKAAAPVKYNLDNLGGVKTAYGADFAKIIREDLKRRGVQGATVRANRSGYTDSITITLKATADDLASVEEYQKRFTFFDFCNQANFHGVSVNGRQYYTFDGMTDAEQRSLYNEYSAEKITRVYRLNNYHHERKDCPEFTTAFYNKTVAAFRIANQWNYDNSDRMTDYYDIGYFLYIDIKIADGTTPRAEMTETERKAYEQEQADEAAARAAEMARIEAEQKEREEAAKKWREWESNAVAGIYNDASVEDLTDADALYITGLAGGIGKEPTIDELLETITDHPTRAKQEAKITRKVIFTSPQAFEDFGKLLLCDFDFLAGKGGTATEDARLTDSEAYYKLTAEQREQIKFYITDAVAVYLGEELKLIIDPEGYNYARYAYIPTDASAITNAAEALKAQADASADLAPFYIPAPVEEQAESLKVGQAVTIYQCDGWILNNIYAGAGVVTDISAGDYAQHKGVWITLQGKKPQRVFIYNGRKCLIYDGIKGALPDQVTGRKVSECMTELYNADDLLKNALEYYKTQGATPLVNTCAS